VQSVSLRHHPASPTLTDVPKPPYPKAPITEAVIQLNVAVDVSEAVQQDVVKRPSKFYPHTANLASFEVQIDGTGGTAKLAQQPNGFRLNTEDQADVALIFPNGLATARLAPYPGWDAFRDRARANWTEWRRASNARQPNRIGVRYVNRLDIPIEGDAGKIGIAKYLEFRPQVPNISGQRPFAGYMQQVTLPTDTPPWSATITSAVVTPPPLLNHISLLLDIDLFRAAEIPANEDELWAIADAARPLKNRIFESCITAEARKLFA
jgi:uncharacterized protein (TIGR04255 family)